MKIKKILPIILIIISIIFTGCQKKAFSEKEENII